MSSITDEEKRYGRFRQLLLMTKKDYSVFISGSCLELPVGCVLSNPTDVDKMYWNKNITASHAHDVSYDQRFPNPTLIIDTTNCHVGFARLRKAHSSPYDIIYYRRPSTPSIQSGKGPSWPKFIIAGSSVTRSLLGCFNQVFHDIDTYKLDYVHAVYCPSWPPEADEWIARERKNGWPPKDVIDKTVGLGCHLVPKPHQSNPDDDAQWRFSFSQAEVILIQSWTDVQKYTYHVLRLIKSEVVKACGAEDTAILCTYFFKTLMLWACEEKPSEFWTDENLDTSVGELLCQMIEWLIDRRCPNYFIPSNNMIDHLANDVDLSKEISALLCYKETTLSKLLTNAPRAYLEIPVKFEVPNKIMEHALLAVSNAYTHEALHVTLGTLHSILSASNNFVPELRYLFDAIQTQLRLAKLMDRIPEFRPDEISSIAKKFDSAKIANDESLLVVTVCLRSSLNDLIDELASFAETHYGFRSLNTHSAAVRHMNENKSMDLAECNDSSRMTDPSDFSYFQHSSNLQAKDKCNSCYFLGDYPEKTEGRSVADENPVGRAISNLFQNLAQNWASPAHLVSSAYCANFYYTSLQDYDLVAEQCRMAFKYLEDLDSSPLEVHVSMFTKAFSVLLTNEWSALFDRNLQLLLGFITLAGDVLAKSQARRRKSLVIRICPLEFLKYIHFQSVRKMDGCESVHFECDFKNAAVCLFNGQRDYEYVSRILLLTAIRVSGIMPHQIGPAEYSVWWPR